MNMLGKARRAMRGSVLAKGLLVVSGLAVGVGWLVFQQAPSAVSTQAAQVSGVDYPYLPNERAVLFRVGDRSLLPDENGLVPHEGNESGNRHVVVVSRQAAEHAAASRGDLRIQLPAGEQFNVKFEHAERASNGDWTFVGKVATRLGPQSAVLTFGRAGLFGVLPVPQGGQMQITTTRGVTVLEPVRPMHPRDPRTGELPLDYVVPEAPGMQMRTQAPATAGLDASPGTAHSERVKATAISAPSAGAPAPAATVGTAAPEVRIDVLGLYTKNMAELRGSAAAAETECNNYLAVANQAHRDSNTGVKLNFVGLRQVDYPATALNGAAFDALASNRLPDGTDVVHLRDSLQADLVAMFRPYVQGDTNGGLGSLSGWGLQGAEGARDSAAFSVNNLSTYTFAHEVGHNLGSMHDLVTSTREGGEVDYGAYAYSFGYRQDGPPKFATIMAYPVNGQPWIGYFSHPGTSSCLGVPCGSEVADNARSMRNMANAIAEYRLPPGLIYIQNRTAIEGDPGSLWSHRIDFRIRLSSPAPAGGVRFDVSTRSGTATEGSDYVAQAARSVVIPEGQRDYTYSVDIKPDVDVEAAETFTVEVSNVSGATIHRAEAVGTLIDDDPRAIVSGRLVWPPGFAMPTYNVQVMTTEVMTTESGANGRYSASYWARPPNFEFRLPVQKGSRLGVEVVDAPVRGDRSRFDLGVVEGDRSIDIVLEPSWLLSGRLTFPVGAPVPNEPVLLRIWGAMGDAWGLGVYASPPDFKYSMRIKNRAAVRVEVSNPPAPLVPQNVWLGEITQDRVLDIPMNHLPSVVVVGQRIKEGAGPKRLDLTVLLSTPAPEAGISVDIGVRSGTAVADRDYAGPVMQKLTFAHNQTSLTFPVTINGDATPERDEWFKVVLSNPSGAWLPSPEAIVYVDNDDAGIPRSDVNGDGRSDLVWHNDAGQRIAWWLMDGASSTADAGQSVASGYRVIGSGDLDGDGLRDLVWRDLGRSQLFYWQGDSSGQYRIHALGAHPDGDALVGVADVDGDGKDDLLWHSPGRGQLSWWLMDGQSRRSFGSRPISSLYEVAGVGDLDGDGRADVVWRDTARTQVWAWMAQPAGGFIERFISPHPVAPWDLVGVEDVDADARVDLVWHNGVEGRLDWWLMNGETRRGVGSQAVPPRYEVVAFADLNGDGRQDVVWTDRARTELWAWLAGTGSFSSSYIGAYPAGGWQLVSARPDYQRSSGSKRMLTDIDGDGRSDLSWRNAAAGEVSWWLMNGASPTASAGQAAGTQFAIVSRGDYNGDGRQDMLWTDTNRTQLWMWVASGAGFEVRSLGAHPPAGWSVAASGDVDGDGRSDVLWHNPELQQIDWWYMDGAARTAVGSQFIPRQYRIAMTGDFNGDHKVDIVWRDAGNTELWLWSGNGYSYSPSWIGAYPSGWQIVAAGDMDGDARDDLVWHNRAVGQVDWWLMQGAQRQGMGSQAVPSRYGVADYGDMDGDRRLDLVWVDDRQTEIWLWHEAAPGRAMRQSLVSSYPAGGWSVVGVH